MLSYNGRVAFGVTGDWDSVADLSPMNSGIDSEVRKVASHQFDPVAEAEAADPMTGGAPRASPDCWI